MDVIQMGDPDSLKIFAVKVNGRTIRDPFWLSKRKGVVCAYKRAVYADFHERFLHRIHKGKVRVIWKGISLGS
jgi:hypothetical protein